MGQYMNDFLSYLMLKEAAYRSKSRLKQRVEQSKGKSPKKVKVEAPAKKTAGNAGEPVVDRAADVKQAASKSVSSKNTLTPLIAAGGGVLGTMALANEGLRINSDLKYQIEESLRKEAQRKKMLENIAEKKLIKEQQKLQQEMQAAEDQHGASGGEPYNGDDRPDLGGSFGGVDPNIGDTGTTGTTGDTGTTGTKETPKTSIIDQLKNYYKANKKLVDTAGLGLGGLGLGGGIGYLASDRNRLRNTLIGSALGLGTTLAGKYAYDKYMA